MIFFFKRSSMAKSENLCSGTNVSTVSFVTSAFLTKSSGLIYLPIPFLAGARRKFPRPNDGRDGLLKVGAGREYVPVRARDAKPLCVLSMLCCGKNPRV